MFTKIETLLGQKTLIIETNSWKLGFIFINFDIFCGCSKDCGFSNCIVVWMVKEILNSKGGKPLLLSISMQYYQSNSN